MWMIWLNNNIKRDTMRRYKVVTDNLDWVDIHRGDVISFTGNDADDFTKHFNLAGGATQTIICPKQFHCGFSGHVVYRHPEWFSEIKEKEPKEFTRRDMENFGVLCRAFNSWTFDRIMEHWEKMICYNPPK